MTSNYFFVSSYRPREYLERIEFPRGGFNVHRNPTRYLCEEFARYYQKICAPMIVFPLTTRINFYDNELRLKFDSLGKAPQNILKWKIEKLRSLVLKNQLSLAAAKNFPISPSHADVTMRAILNFISSLERTAQRKEEKFCQSN